MTDDEEDSAVKPIPEKKPFKISSRFFFLLLSFFFFLLAHSMKPISAAVLSCQLRVWRHRRTVGLQKYGAGGGKWGRLHRLWVSVLK